MKKKKNLLQTITLTFMLLACINNISGQTNSKDYLINFHDTICYGMGYHSLGFSYEQLPAGMYFDTLYLLDINGEDSIVCLNLYVAAVYDTVIYDTICYNEEPYLMHGFHIDSLPEGVYFDTINPGTIFGCDSMIYLDLLVLPSYDINIYDTIVYGEDYYWNGFCFENPTVGLHADTLYLTTFYGCDSIITLNLCVRELAGITEDFTADVSLYPNPCNSYINIEGDGIEIINIYSPTGILVKTEKYGKNDKVTVDVSQLQTSLYLFEVITTKGRCLKRITVTTN